MTPTVPRQIEFHNGHYQIYAMLKTESRPP